MVTETGIVIQTTPDTAWVKTTRYSSCAGCSGKDTCHSLGGGKEMEVEAINTAGAKPGDRVVLSFETGAMLKLSFLLYIFPVAAMVAGAVLGQHLAPQYRMDESAAAILFCFLAFALSFLVIKLLGIRLSGNERYRARVIRISRVPGGRPAACKPEADQAP